MDSLSTMPRYEAYKESGVDWIGNIPRHWSVERIKSIGDIVNGATPNSGVSFYWNGNVVWVAPTDINNIKYIYDSARKLTKRGYESCGTTLIPAGSLVLTCRAPIGKVVVAGVDLCTNQGCKSIVLKNGVENRFAYYAFLIVSEKLNSLGTGTTFLELSTGALKNFRISLPSTEEQSTIANFLDKKTAQIDEAIAIKEKQIALLKERKQIIIQKAVTQGLEPNVPMKDSGVDWIGQIPAHWEIIKLKHLFKENTVRSSTGTEVLLSLRMEIGLVPHNDVSDKHIPCENLVDYKIVQAGQLVMNRMRAAIGIFGIANDYGLVSPDYAVFDVIGDVNSQYYLTLFKLPLMGTQFRLESKGMGTGSSGFMRLYTENFGNIKVPNPPVEEQEKLMQFISQTEESTAMGINHLQIQIEKLQEYKTTLINSAVTGKIKVA